MTGKIYDTHGGNIYRAAQKYGIEEHEILDFSANINPLGVPPDLKEALISGIDRLVNYPDPEYGTLKMQISLYLDVEAEKIIVGNGASEIIFLLFDVIRPKKLLVPAPTFLEYSKAAESRNVEVEYFELKEEENFELHVPELMLKMNEGCDALLLCNPNNPTSTMVKKEELYKLLDFAAGRGMFVIIDEAFIELTAGGNRNSIVDALKSYPNLFIIRAFTKLFAVPGLRLGYGLGSEEIVEKMWKKKLPWSVNSMACCIGEILNDCSGYLADTAAWLEREKAWLYDELAKIPGLKVFQPQTNFILIKLLKNGWSVGKLREKMAQKGVLIRDASNFTFLGDKFIRIAVKDRMSNERFLEVLKEVF